MTAGIRRILVAIRDLHETPRAALRKAAALARASGAHIELFHAAVPPGATAMGSGLNAAARRVMEAALAETIVTARRRLERTGRSALLRGCRVESQVVIGAPAHEAVVRRVLAGRFDLLIAGTRSHSLAGRLFLANTDWELIRHCPCPLLLARPQRTYHKPRILVAVDPFHAHAKPARLDEALLAEASRLARLLDGVVHAFHAYMPLIANVQSMYGEPLAWESPQLEEMHTAQVRRRFDALCERAGIAPARRHLVMGDVPDELAATARRIGASIIVMGAVSRSALRRLVIGNTAERVLDRIQCDCLIVKPRGFRAAVRRTTVRAKLRRAR